MLKLGDCLVAMQDIDDESIDLVYLDPPFNTNRLHKTKSASFSDIFDSIDSYMCFIEERMVEIHRVLKITGSVYLHCDPSVSHYLKILMDSIFGIENFRNEIIWHYGLGGFNVKNWFPKKHDTILYYSKSCKNHHQKIRGKINKWMDKKYSKEDETGRYFLQNGTKYYLKGGKPIDTLWDNDELVDYTMSQTSPERVDYPTQKPLVLLERIITASSFDGEIVLDPFCGSGTTLVAAKNLGREYIGIDKSEIAISICRDRLKEFDNYLTNSV